ncbi:P2Y purinoceptor 11-like [Conger conger]|uniref:P2Y purinoceptor 11-like n=1 Tax=Conger conger TaxID=82655 RepID=UPI002A5AD29F|nr:P2Y purinoceptor 11-like [Conger conger]
MLTRRQHDRHAGLVFSVNLAVSDLLCTLTLPLLAHYYFNGKHWVFGEVLCKIQRFTFTSNLYGSMFFIACISVTRYLAIAHPFFTHSYSNLKHAYVVSFVVWIVNVAICVPVFKFASTSQSDITNYTECVTASGKDNQMQYFPYSLFLAAFGCALPFLATLFSYIGILRSSSKNSSITDLEKKKLVQVAATVVTMYTISFIPYHVLLNLNWYLKLDPETAFNRTVYWPYQVTKALVSLSPCVHPLLYAALLDSIRRLCGRTCSSK